MKTRPTRKKGLPDDVRDKHPSAGEQAGEAVGGIGGTVAGAALGSLAGPIGTILGGIAGAVGGWWAGERAGRAVEDLDDHDVFYRTHYEKNPITGMGWDDARIGYGIGHIAGRNPDYVGLNFDEIEEDLRVGWAWEDRDYETMRPYVKTGYERTIKR